MNNNIMLFREKLQQEIVGQISDQLANESTNCSDKMEELTNSFTSDEEIEIDLEVLTQHFDSIIINY